MKRTWLWKRRLVLPFLGTMHELYDASVEAVAYQTTIWLFDVLSEMHGVFQDGTLICAVAVQCACGSTTVCFSELSEIYTPSVCLFACVAVSNNGVGDELVRLCL